MSGCLQYLKNGQPYTLNIPLFEVGLQSFGITPYYDQPNDFSFMAKDYILFDQAYKVFPLIGFDGNIYCIGQSGFDKLGYMGSRTFYDDDKEIFGVVEPEPKFKTEGRWSVFYFQKAEDAGVEYLHSPKDDQEVRSLKLIPIPYSATHIGDWKGMSFSTNTASFELMNQDMNKQIQTVKNSPQRSFIPTQWSDITNWSGQFTNKSMHPQHFGMIAPNTAIFGTLIS